NQAGSDGIIDSGHDNRDRWRELLRRADRGDCCGENDAHLGLLQLACQRGKATVIVCKAYFEEIIATLDHAVFLETLRQACQKSPHVGGVRGPGAEKSEPNRRLRACLDERPRCRSADQADELPSPHPAPLLKRQCSCPSQRAGRRGRSPKEVFLLIPKM